MRNNRDEGRFAYFASPVRAGELVAIPRAELPEMIRDDNGKLSGYIYVDLQGVTGPDYVDNAQQFLRKTVTLPTSSPVSCSMKAHHE